MSDRLRFTTSWKLLGGFPESLQAKTKKTVQRNISLNNKTKKFLLMNLFRWANHRICLIEIDMNWHCQKFWKCGYLKYFYFSKTSNFFQFWKNLSPLTVFEVQEKQKYARELQINTKTCRALIFDLCPQTSVKNYQTLTSALWPKTAIFIYM